MLKPEVFGSGVCKNRANRLGTKIAYAPKKTNSLRPGRGRSAKKKRGLATSHGLCSHTPRVPKFHTRARDVWLTLISRATWRPRGERTLSVADSYTPYLWALGTSLLPYFPLCNYILAYSGENVNTFFKIFLKNFGGDPDRFSSRSRNNPCRG